MSEPDVVAGLVERFYRNLSDYRSQQYNETQLRREFVDPFFAALGWDVDNTAGYAEAYKDVVHEDAIKVAGKSKAPDYSFRIGGVRKFFVETKRPAVNVQRGQAAAFQIRRYAWSAKLPLSILTDFEEFSVYDCRVKPQQTDRASTARTLYIPYTDYTTRWDEIAGIFAKEAVLSGSFDRYVASAKRKRGTAEVDEVFLQELETWREQLARNIALRNPDLGVRGLNFAVQQTLDRIIFLRICEDRGIEPYGALRDTLKGEGVYQRLGALFERADDRYDSGLFYFRAERGRPGEPDMLTLGLQIDDRVLKHIISSLYYPHSPYEFSVLRADILGQVYEQFLGRVIRLTPGGRAKVEEKPEVKKAGGVYYTPSFIVDYIVEHTLGQVVSGKTPKHVAELAVLDPACGSGSFLIAAYQYLLDWHLAYYVQDDPQAHARGRPPRVFAGPTGDWRLTTIERKRILLDNIYGVDIDPQAVEVTKLSLLLKVLEGESQGTLAPQIEMFRERVLPDLGQNIKCGNSLVGPQFYSRGQLAGASTEDALRVNVFDWQREFPTVFSGAKPGFDVVIGNPPWGQKGIGTEDAIKRYLRNTYDSLAGIFDLFRPFVERGVELTRQDGCFGMVLPDIVLLKNYESTRRLMLEELELTHIDWWGMAFADAVIDAATVIGRKATAPDGHVVRVHVRDPDRPIEHAVPQVDFWRNDRLVFNLYMTAERREVLTALSACPRLDEYFEAHEGVHSGNIRSELFVDNKVDESCRPLLFGRDEIAPYRLTWAGRYVRLSAVPAHSTRERYANVGQPGWYERDKVLVRRTGDYILAAVDRERRYASNNFFLVIPTQSCALTLDGLCALLNSQLMTWFFRTIEPRQGRVFAELKIKHLSTIPLPRDLKSAKAMEQLNRLGLHQADLARRLPVASGQHERTVLERQFAMTNEEINNEVYRMLDPSLAQVTFVREDITRSEHED